ncbi:MAG: hypothetical protein Q8L74_12935 [Nitrospirota bacterium]|nr:hypothetical protein [Nitrospirota bacterium]
MIVPANSQRLGTAEWPADLFDRVTDILAEALVLDHRQSVASFNATEPIIDSPVAQDDNWPDNVWCLDCVREVSA